MLLLQLVLLVDQKISVETFKFCNENNIIINRVVGITVIAARPSFKGNEQVKKNHLNYFPL